MGLHEFIQPAVREAVAETLGTVVDANGDLVTPPQVAAFYAQFLQMQTDLTASKAQVQQLLTNATQQAAAIDQLTNLLNGKASQSSLNTVSQRVTTLSTTVDGKAATAYVDQQVQTISGIDASQAQAITAIQNALGVDEGKLQSLLATQTAQAGLLTDLRADVNSKAPSATVSNLSGQVTTLRNTVNDPSTGLVTKASATDLTSGLASKVNLTDYTTALAGKVNTADFATALASKVNVADFTPVANAFSNSTTGLAATYTLASTNAAAINNASTGLAATKALADANASGLTAANRAISNRLRKDQADSTTYSLGVPIATGMDKAVQKSELVGGIQRPYRLFQNVGTTPVPAYVRAGQSAPITDGLGLGQVYALTNVRLKTITAPLVAATIKLFSNGTEVYTTSVSLATIPAVGKTLDLLALTGATLPADITLPATLTATSSAGTFEIIADGILK